MARSEASTAVYVWIWGRVGGCKEQGEEDKKEEVTGQGASTWTRALVGISSGITFECDNIEISISLSLSLTLSPFSLSFSSFAS